jgi:SAM-dependent methyltransferase
MERQKKSRWLIVASHICHNLLFEFRSRLGKIRTVHGATHLAWKPEQSVRYIQRVFSDYHSFGNITDRELAGARVLEVGPGDNLGVALLFIAHGAEQVVCLDKFYSERNAAQEAAIYSSLRESLEPIQRERFDTAVKLGNSCCQIDPERVRLICGTGLEDSGSLFEAESFDMIVSRAVLMEIHYPGKAFASMDRLLRPGGILLHKVAPLNDYRMFRANGYHPLEFLTVPQFLYNKMAAGSGKPNRRLLGYYHDELARRHYEASFPIVKLLGSDEEYGPGVTSVPYGSRQHARAAALVKEIRPRLSRSFRAAPDEQLMIEDMFIVARKMQQSARTGTAAR